MPAFADKSYYPVLLGDVYLNRYKVITKLGYGSNSTVWLSLDQKYNSFVALKIYACTSHALRESRILAELAKIRSQHIGMTAIRPVLDSFGLISEDGNMHVCLVHPPVLVSPQGFQDLFRYTVLPTTIFRAVIYDILVAIGFLHTKAQMVHTDIQASNIVLGSKDSSIFEKLLEAEHNNPSARKTIDKYIIYQSQALTLDEIIDNIGPLYLTDFGEARTRADGWHGLIQPDPFRSPEVILKMPWTRKTDIWNLGVMAWRLFEDHLLFSSRDSEGNHSDAQLLAHITAILDPA
ncbi:kinase-like protein, partial [Aureobasidium melanogenum]